MPELERREGWIEDIPDFPVLMNGSYAERYNEFWYVTHRDSNGLGRRYDIRAQYKYVAGADNIPVENQVSVLCITENHRQLALWFGATSPSYQYFYERVKTRIPQYCTGLTWEATLREHDRYLGDDSQSDAHDQALRAWCAEVFHYVKKNSGYCDACNKWGHTEEDAHDTCDNCEGAIAFGASPFTYTRCYEHSRNAHPGANPIFYCGDCMSDVEDLDYFTCSYCSHLHYQNELIEYNAPSGEPLCTECFQENFAYCCTCGSGPEYRTNMSYIEYEGEWECSDCHTESQVIHLWDYRPELIFHPPVPTSKKNPLYIGMELECSFRVDNWYRRDWSYFDQDLIYIKEDSSVANGFEFVTHPMEPRWALKHFPFSLFQDLIDKRIAYEDDTSTGTHIHMNKEAFGTAHLWKFMQIHFRLGDFCQTVGGRKDSHWGQFKGNSIKAQRTDLMHICKEKGKPFTDYDRYVAVNLRNEYTIELRYMAGSINPAIIKKNIEWALALYEFSDYLSVDDVRNGALDNPGYLLWWINKGNYPWLAGYIQRYIPSPLALKERTN